MMNKQALVPCVAIAGIALVECVALFMGMNGALLTLSVAAIAGLAGLTLPQLKIAKK